MTDFSKAPTARHDDALDDATASEAALLARALVRTRTAAQMTQQQVADAMGTTRTVIARLESGRGLPSTRTLQRFARATGSELRISFAPSVSRTVGHGHHASTTPSTKGLPMSRDLRDPYELLKYLTSRRALLGTAGAVAGGAALTRAANPVAAQTPIASPAASPAAEGYTTITTPLGTYDIPTNPQRVVTIDSRLDLEPAIALNLPVIATCYDNPTAWVPTSPDLLAFPGIVDVEQVAALEPDLIICVNLDNEWWPAPTLNQIAPVVTTEFEIHWRDNLTNLSQWLGTTERLEEALAEYDALIADIQTRHAEKIAEKQIVYLQFFPEDGVVRYNIGQFLQAFVLQDIGGTPLSGFQDLESAVISTERLVELADADGFLVQNFGDSLYEYLEEDVLWQTLPAVKAGAVTVTRGNTNYGSIYTATELAHLYDDLYGKIV